ncbi:MAG: hypothetical protein LBJ10_11115, partial [Clostridiales bacterium]|nr:hypothetical protein [Clostridiales bacterium]
MARLVKKPGVVRLPAPATKPAAEDESLAGEYMLLKEQEKAIKKRKDAIAAILKEAAEKRGSMSDTGTYSLD